VLFCRNLRETSLQIFKLIVTAFFTLLAVCISRKKRQQGTDSLKTADFTIALGSCNKQNIPTFMDDVGLQPTQTYGWGGDNVYANTINMQS